MLIDEKNNIWKTVNPQWATNIKYRVRYVEHHPCDSVSLVENPESNNLVELAIPVNNREYAESMLTYDNLIKLRDSIILILKSNNVE
ncbi:hypothetical protein HYO65_gp266 [Tenacibaculum phage PTm1]|uniref:Uncharacterized protein n=2 Tax=Shirahamavirus PTm1 TaxID=2846435 RepID=A0A5S9EQV9_9CAUD|nr:hypothetical protein HYO65_gp266 [Tenacibaculum phage PTm1]BBI90658.1 hypothetical protein [Tenacibaculum phage PTm1]BBI90963.1 hypothetical protein [Tenacibaculum phage PTm5]